jgi:hypothetical protein
MQRFITFLMVAASLVFAFIVLQNHFGITERFERWRADFSPADLRNKDYQLNFDVAGKKGTISIKAHPPQDQDLAKGPQKAVPGHHRKSKNQPQEASESGTKSQ